MKKFNVKIITILLCLLVSTMFMPKTTYALGSSPMQHNRISGDDRYATSAAIAQAGWNTSYYAILASGENFPDALCAAPLAAKYNAPILLTSANRLEDATKDELIRLNVKNVVMIGGEGVLSAKVRRDIQNLGIGVSRLAGQDRYETSLEVAKAMGSVNEAVIATGEDFPDVLSIAPIAAQKGMPILLTPQNSLSAEHHAFLDKTVRKTYVLGDSGVISDSVVDQLPLPRRLSGTNRYQANINIINAFKQDLDLSTCYLATGKDYPDALSGAALAALSKSPVILVNDPLAQATTQFIQDNSSVVSKITAFGGSGAVGDSLLYSIAPADGTGSGTNLVPTSVVANTLSEDQIYLAWNSVSNATSYNVYRSNIYGGTYTKIATVNTPYYSDKYLSPGTTYYYKVQGVSNTSFGDYSTIVYATTQSNSIILSAPDNLTATPLTDNKIYLTWNTVMNAVSYNVYRTTADSGIYTIIATVNAPYYSDESVATGTNYFYKVQAANTSGTGPYSTVVAATALLSNSALTAPSNVTATAMSTKQIFLSWAPVSKASYYNIYRSTSFNGTYTSINLTPLPYYTDSNLSSGQMYYYKIQAVNTTGPSQYSNIVYAKSN